MPQQPAGTGMRVAEELALRGAKEKKEIARLRRWCREISSQCRHGKSQREKEEEERTRRYAEQDAAEQREQMDAHAIMLERQRLEAERYRGSRLDGVLVRLEKQIEKQKKEVACCPPPQAVLKLKQAVAMVTTQQAMARKLEEPRSDKWFYRLDAAEEEYLTSLFRKTLEGKKKGKKKDKAQGEQKRDHVTLQELKEIMIACGGADVPLRYLRPQSAEYFERTQGADGMALEPFLAFMFLHRQQNLKRFEKVEWKIVPVGSEVKVEKKRPVKGVRPVSGIRRYIDVSEYPFLVDIRRKPTGKEDAAALSRLPRPTTAGASVGLVGDDRGNRPERPMTAARKPFDFPARPATSMGLSREPAGLRTPIQRGSTRNLFHQDSNQDLHLHSMHGHHQLERSLSLGRVVTSSERDVDLATAVAIRVNAQRAWYDGRGTVVEHDMRLVDLNRSIDLYERSFEQDAESEEEREAGYVDEAGEARMAKGKTDMKVEESMLPHGGGYSEGEGSSGGEGNRVRPTTAVRARIGSSGDEFSSKDVRQGGQKDSYIRTYMHLDRFDIWRSPPQGRAMSSGVREECTPENDASPVREQIAYHMVFPTGTSCVSALPVGSLSTRQEERGLSEEEEAIIARVGRVLRLT